MTDYSRIGIGAKTPHGEVKMIYSAASDYIIFVNDAGDIKVLTERQDNVYQEAFQQSNDLNASAYRKFSLAYKNGLRNHLAACWGRALQPNVNVRDIKGIFKPLRDYIRSKHRIKKAIASGPNPPHFVFIDHLNNACCNYLPNNDERLGEYIAELNVLMHLAAEQLNRWTRRDVAAAIGSAMGAIFHTTNEDKRKLTLAQTKLHVEKKVREYHHASYFFQLLFSSILLAALAHFASSYLQNISSIWATGIFGGLLGAFYSSVQRLKAVDFDVYQSQLSVLVQAFSRSVLGAIAGIVVVSASESGLALSIIQNNYYATLLAGFAGGFSERFVPDLIFKVIQ